MSLFRLEFADPGEMRAVRAGARLLVVSDRAAGPTRAPIPMLLAIGAIRQELVRTGLRARHAGGEAGVSTLEMVIIALGLMAVAGVLVAAITAAVTSRTDQIK